MWNKQQQKQFDKFISEIKKINWFSTATQIDRKYTVLTSIYEAHDILGDEVQCVWENESTNLNNIAMQKLSSEQIDEVFTKVSLAIGDELWDKLCDFEEMLQNLIGEAQGGVEEDITDFIKRDTSWACIEYILGIDSFFTKVYNINKTGRFVCSWSGEYPKGQFIIM